MNGGNTEKADISHPMFSKITCNKNIPFLLSDFKYILPIEIVKILENGVPVIRSFSFTERTRYRGRCSTIERRTVAVKLMSVPGTCIYIS